MPFSSVIGQDRAVEILRRELARGRVSHAYLFTGMEGVGKRYTALALAMALLCRREAGEGCGVCPSCRKIRQGTHPDVRLYAPEARKKGAPEKIYIDQIRTLRQEILLRSMEGGGKVCIIDRADRMVPQAANALLKTLEEPPEESVLILVTAYPDLLPGTIPSRCRPLAFGPLAREAVTRILMREKGLSEEETAPLVPYAQGSVERVLEMDLSGVVSRRDRFREWIGAWDPREIGSLFDLSQRVAGKAGEAMEFLEFLLTWNRDLIALKLCGEGGTLLHRDRLSDLTEEAAGRTLAELLHRAESLEQGQQRIRGNVNPRLAVEAALIRAVHAGRA